MTRLLLAFFVLLSFTACRDDEMMTPEPLVCENGFIEENGECVCPEGNITAYNNCLELREDQYFGITTGCPCEDTLIVSVDYIGEIDPVREVKINEDIVFDSNSAQFFPQRNVFMILNQTETGDSTLWHAVEDDFFLSCDLDADDGYVERARAFGSFAEGGNALDFTFTYLDSSGNESATCTFRLEK